MPAEDEGGPPASFSTALVPSQPTNLLLPFFTQDDYAEQVIARRIRSTAPVIRSDNLPLYSCEDIDKLRDTVWQVLQERLSKHGISLAGLNQRFFSWLLPKNDASVQDWKAFLSNPLLVDTETLKELFSLEQSTAESYVDRRKNILLYIRTFAFTVEDLLEVLQDLLDDEIPNDNIMSLIESVQGLPMDHVVYVRYGGQTTSGSAYKRHYTDLMRREPKFMTRFLQATLRKAPEVIDEAEVHEIVDATMVNFPYYDTDMANKREQALIALLDMTVSLNTQIGGTWASARPYLPSDTDTINFNALGTNLMQEMHNKCSPCPDTIVNQIDAYAQKVQAYTVKSPESTGSAIHAITDRVRNMIRDQAIPKMIGKYSLMVTIGSDLPPNAIADAYSFYGGHIDSGNLCAGILNQLGSWEIGQYMKIIALTVELQKAQCLPFVDLYPWTKKTDSDLPIALATLRSYLQSTKPFIVLTFSHKVSSAAAGSFQHPHGIKAADYRDMIGKLIMSKYDEDPATEDDDNCVIVIPCYHPGVVGHNSHSSETQLRMISHVLMITWLAMDRVAKLSSDSQLTKKEICEKVCTQVEALTGPTTTFGIALDKLKEALDHQQTIRAPKAPFREHINFTTRHEALVSARAKAEPKAKAGSGYTFTYDHGTKTLLTSRNRWTAAKDELYQIVTCEVASPRPQRKEQIARLAGMAIPLLQHEQYDFRKLAQTIADGRSYYLEVSDRAGRLKDIPNLLSIHLPSEHNPNSSAWKKDAAAVKHADDTLLAWLRKEILKPSTPSESAADRCMPALTKLLHTKDKELAKRLRAKAKVLDVPKLVGDSLQGAQVVIKPRTIDLKDNNVLAMKWESDGREHELKDLAVPTGVIPLDPDEQRYIYFVPGGVDIRDSNNRTLGVSSFRDTTISLSMMHKVSGNEAALKPFLALWERETGLKVDDQMFGPVDSGPGGVTFVYPASYFKGTGKSWESFRAISKTKKAGIIQDGKPVQPEDASWLVHKFLLEHYPNVGDVVDTGNPLKWPSPESDVVWLKLET